MTADDVATVGAVSGESKMMDTLDDERGGVHDELELTAKKLMIN